MRCITADAAPAALCSVQGTAVTDTNWLIEIGFRAQQIAYALDDQEMNEPARKKRAFSKHFILPTLSSRQSHRRTGQLTYQ